MTDREEGHNEIYLIIKRVGSLRIIFEPTLYNLKTIFII